MPNAISSSKNVEEETQENRLASHSPQMSHTAAFKTQMQLQDALAHFCMYFVAYLFIIWPARASCSRFQAPIIWQAKVTHEVSLSA